MRRRSSDTVHSLEEFAILVKAPATSIPDHVEVSIEGIEAGYAVRVSGLGLPAGAELELDAETVIVSIQEAAAEEAEEASEEAAAAGDAEGGPRSRRFPVRGRGFGLAPSSYLRYWEHE